MEQEGDVGKDGGDPHEGKHLNTDVGLDVELVLCRQSDFGGNANDGRDDSDERDKNGGDSADDRKYQTPPAGAYDKAAEEHEDKVDADAGHKGSVYDFRANLEEFQDGDDLRRERNLATRKQFAN